MSSSTSPRCARPKTSTTRPCRPCSTTGATARTLVLEPGDLQLFKGRYALHRVRPAEGAARRYVAIFSFVEKEGMVGSPERTRQLYGRVLPIHLERAGYRDNALID